MRTCTKCQKAKPLEDFPIKTKGKKTTYRAQCKDCRNAYMREYYARPEVNVKHKKRVYSNPNRKAIKRKHFASLYGFESVEAWEKFKAEHPDTCPLCLSEPAVHTDHDHETGQPRAMLGVRCNLLLGLAKDNPETLRRAAAYLEEHKSKVGLDKSL